MKLKISATNVKQGGVTVAEYVIDRPTREQALTEGIAELLTGPTFPPEAVKLYRLALAKDFSRDEAQDQILSDFGLQFFASEVNDHEVPPAPTPTHPFATVAPPTPQPPAQFPAAANRTPRQLLQAKLAELKAQQAICDRQYTTLKKQRDYVKGQLEECRRLLRAPRKPKLVAVRKRKSEAQV